jgi:tungstate transport system substrate-binding protein
MVRVSAVVAALISALINVQSALAQERSITVGAPSGALISLLQELGPMFRADTGVEVRVARINPGGSSPDVTLDAAIKPSHGSAPREDAGSRAIFFGEAVLVGSRADRARVKGLRDIGAALRWISSARGLYVASSPALGLRELELSLWDSIGVNVRTRLTWYVEASGDEDRVYSQAADLGAYVLVERATWAAQRDRRGLEMLVAGDPMLRTTYSSQLLRSSDDARSWHEWLSSETSRAAISGWRLGGIQVFAPAAEPALDRQGVLHDLKPPAAGPAQSSRLFATSAHP